MWGFVRVHRSTSAAYLTAIGLRLSFCLGVSSSPPGNHSADRIVQRLICSGCESLALAACMLMWIAAIYAGSRESSATGVAVSPC